MERETQKKRKQDSVTGRRNDNENPNERKSEKFDVDLHTEPFKLWSDCTCGLENMFSLQLCILQSQISFHLWVAFSINSIFWLYYSIYIYFRHLKQVILISVGWFVIDLGKHSIASAQFLSFMCNYNVKCHSKEKKNTSQNLLCFIFLNCLNWDKINQGWPSL